MKRRTDAAEAPQDSAEREAFFDWLDDVAAQNAAQNVDLSDDKVLAIIEEARSEAAAKSNSSLPRK